MLIEKIQLRNFLSFSDTTFEIGATGLLLVSGDNGAGKSSISSKAITWVFFGETPGGVKGDDVVNVLTPKRPSSVKAWFTVQGRPWIIERTRNPGRLVVTNVDEGREMSFRNPKETQDFVNTLIGRDLNAFLASDYFGQDSKRRFLQQTPSVQQSIVEEILRIEPRVQPLVEESKKRVAQVAEERDETKGLLQEHKGQGNSLEGQRTTLEAQLQAAKEERQAIEDAPQPVLREVPEVGPAPVLEEPSPPAEIPDPEPPEQADLGDIFLVKESLSEERTNLQTEFTAAQTSLTEARGHERQAYEGFNTLQGQAAAKKSQIRPVEENLCPECGQTVDAQKVQELHDRNTKTEQEYNTITEQSLQMKATWDGWTVAVKKREGVVSDIQAKLSQVETRLTALDRDIRSASEARDAYERAKQEVVRRREAAQANYQAQKDQAVAVYRGALKHWETRKAGVEEERAKALQDFQEAVRQREIRIATVDAKATQIAQQIASLKAEIKKTTKTVEALQAKVQELNDMHRRVSFWGDVFRNSFKRFMIEECVPFLNERTAHHLALLGNPHLEVNFSTTKTLKSGDEKSAFAVQAYTCQGGQQFGSLSGGERQMVSFAVGLSLSELADAQSGSSSEFLILDEPFTELDPKNCASVIHYITTELSKRKHSILLISNDPNLRQLVANRVEVTKDSTGISQLAVG